MFERNLPAVIARKPQWDALLQLFLVLFLLDVAVRRVVIDWRAIGRRVAMAYANFVGAVRPGAESTVTMERLKARREAVQQEYTAGAEVPLTAEPADAAPDRGARFDMADRVGKDRLAQIRERMDQAKQDAARPAPAGGGRPAGKEAGDQKQEDVQSMSRLLAAKKRAREEMDEGKDG